LQQPERRGHVHVEQQAQVAVVELQDRPGTQHDLGGVVGVLGGQLDFDGPDLPGVRAGRDGGPPDLRVGPVGADGRAFAADAAFGLPPRLVLGYDKAESFRRARTRNPIPGEGKTEDGRPCWTSAALRSWQSKRKIAGNRAPAGEPD
jgi:hypothetical protein